MQTAVCHAGKIYPPPGDIDSNVCKCLQIGRLVKGCRVLLEGPIRMLVERTGRFHQCTQQVMVFRQIHLLNLQFPVAVTLPVKYQ